MEEGAGTAAATSTYAPNATKTKHTPASGSKASSLNLITLTKGVLMTLNLFKSVRSAAVLASIAGVLMFAGGAFAAPEIIKQTGSPDPEFGTVGTGTYLLKYAANDFAGGPATISLPANKPEGLFVYTGTSGTQASLTLVKTEQSEGHVIRFVTTAKTPATEEDYSIRVTLNGTGVGGKNNSITLDVPLVITKHTLVKGDLEGLKNPGGAKGEIVYSGHTSDKNVYAAKLKSTYSATVSRNEAGVYYYAEGDVNDNGSDVTPKDADEGTPLPPTDVGVYYAFYQVWEAGNLNDAVVYLGSFEITKAVATITWPTFSATPFDKNKPTLADYAITGSNPWNDDNGGAKGVGDDGSLTGTFSWFNAADPVSAATTVYTALWTPTGPDNVYNNYKISWNSKTKPNDVVGHPEDNDYTKNTGLTFKFDKAELGENNVELGPPKAGTEPDAFQTATEAGLTTREDVEDIFDGKAVWRTYNGAVQKVVFRWVDLDKEDGEKTGPSDQGARTGTKTGDTLSLTVGYVGTTLANKSYGSASNPSTTAPTDAGVYTVFVKVGNTAGNYSGNWLTADDDSWNLVILPRELTVTKLEHFKVYDATNEVTDVGNIKITIAKGGNVNTPDGKIIGTQSIAATATSAAYSGINFGVQELNIFDATLSGTGSANYTLKYPNTYTSIGDDDEHATGDKCIQKDVVKGTKAAPGGIRQRPITIAATGHSMIEKEYNGDSLCVVGATTDEEEGTSIAVVNLAGNDEFVYDVDYKLTKAAYKGPNVGEGIPVVAGSFSLIRGTEGARTLAYNYVFAKAADSLLNGKGITGSVVPKPLDGQYIAFDIGGDVKKTGKQYTGAPITLKDTAGNVSKAEFYVYDIPTSLYDKPNKKSILKKSDYELVYEDNVTVTEEAKVWIKAKEGGNYRDPDEDLEPVLFNIIKKKLTLATTGHKVDDRFYHQGDRSVPIVSLNFVGLVAGDVLTLQTEDQEGDYTIDGASYSTDEASDAAKAVTAGELTFNDDSEIAANYELDSKVKLSGSGIKGFVRKMPLIITDVETGESRVYNGQDTVNVVSVTFVTVEDQDADGFDIGARNTGYTVSGAKYADASVGAGKEIAAGTIVLKGTSNVKNYTIPDPSIAGYGSDEITPRSLSISSATITKPYDGSATLETENVTLNFASAKGDAGLISTDKGKDGYTVIGGAFADEAIKTGKSIVSGSIELTDFLAENYTLDNPDLAGFTGSITKGIIPLIVTHTKVYDGKVDATDAEYTADPNGHPLWFGDVMEHLNAITWKYTSKNAGTTTVQPTGTVLFKTTAPKELTDFYTFSSGAVDMGTGGITKKPLPIATVTHSKAYDGTTDAKITNIGFPTTANGGLVTGDAANTVVIDSVEAEYTSPSVGTTTVVLKSVALKGTNGGNYAVIIPETAITVTGTPAGIVGATATIDKVTATKTYDGTNILDPLYVQVSFKGIADVDTPFVDYDVSNVTLVDKNAGTKLISGGKVELINAALENYIFPATAGNLQGKGFTVTVAPKTLKILAAEHTKAYDGTTAAKDVKVILDEGGLVGTDTAAVVTSVEAQYTSSMLGTKTLKITKVTVAGGNYTADTATITLAEGGITGTYVDSITVSSATGADSVTGRRTVQFTANVFPTTASIRAVAWSVSDTSLATINATGQLTTKKNGTVVVTAASTDGSGKKGTFTLKISGVGVLEAEREIPTQVVISEAAVAPVKAVVAKFTAGPSPVKVGSSIKFFSGSAVKSGSLYIFDASGNAVAKVSAKAGSGEIGSWDLKGKNGAVVSEGSYIVKGALVGKDGTREKVSFVFSVVK